MQKTLGGERLGAGKKMKVELHNYERSSHDIGYVWRSTMAAGTLVPFMSEVALPGTTIDLELNVDIKTHPTIGPLFGSYKVQLDVFQCPIRLYNAHLHNNALGIGRNMANIKLPQIEYKSINIGSVVTQETDIDNLQINPSALPAYLGLRGVGVNQIGAVGSTATRQFNAVPTLAYWEIYKNYYANKQEEIGAVIHANTTAILNTITAINLYPNGVSTPLPQAPASTVITLQSGEYIQTNWSGVAPDPNQVLFNTNQGWKSLSQLSSNWTQTAAGVNTGTYTGATIIEITQWKYVSNTDAIEVEPRVETFPLSNIDDMRMAILGHNFPTAFVIDENIVLTPYLWLVEQPEGRPNILSSQEGLAIKTYNSDLLNNWLKTENIEAISTATAVDTSGGSFTIDQLVISRKVWNMLNRINVSGGSYDDWLDAVYVHERYKSPESPMYMGGLIKELVFQEVVSNSESQSGQPLGTLAGKGVLGGKHKGGHVVINVDEPSYIIGIISLTPRVDYSQGNKWDVHLKTMDDFHKPALDEIGFQDLIMEQAAWWDTRWDGTEWNQHSAGKQPAWMNYMTNLNQTRGNFAMKENEMFMTLNRRYEGQDLGLGIQDMTTYIDPAKYNFIFAEQQLDAQNFWAQIGLNMTARRKMSAKIMPNL